MRARSLLHFIACTGVTSLHSTIGPTSRIILSSLPGRQVAALSTSVASSLGAWAYRSTSVRLDSFTNDSALSTITSLCPLINPNERHSSRMSAASSFSPSNWKVSSPPTASASFSLNDAVCCVRRNSSLPLSSTTRQSGPSGRAGGFLEEVRFAMYASVSTPGQSGKRSCEGYEEA